MKYMKRLFVLLTAFILVLSLFPVQAICASQPAEILEVIRYEDGSYLEITLESVQTRASSSVTKTKTYTYRDDENNAIWKASLTASFTYTGSSATCTSSSCTTTVYDSDWYLVSKSADRSGNTATADVTFGRKVLGVTVKKVSYTITMTCDANGNVK